MRPGLSVPPQQDRGSDALAPWRQQETDTCEVNKNLLGQGEISLHHTATSRSTPVTAPRICPDSCAAPAWDLAWARAASPMHWGSSTPPTTGLEVGEWGKE